MRLPQRDEDVRVRVQCLAAAEVHSVAALVPHHGPAVRDRPAVPVHPVRIPDSVDQDGRIFVSVDGFVFIK